MFYLIFFLFGLAIGSFINVLIYRTEKEENFVKGRSKCPKCKENIAWYDNIPLLSYVILRAKCRKCGNKISSSYFVIEFATGIVFLIFAIFCDNFLLKEIEIYSLNLKNSIIILMQTLYIILIITVLIAIFIFDFKHFIIPNEFVYFGIITAFLFICLIEANKIINLNSNLSLINLNDKNHNYLLNGIIAALIAGGFFFLQVYISNEKWLGWGDVKMGILMGLILGYPYILIGMFLSYLIGSIIGLLLILTKNKKGTSQVPFGPFLSIGTYLAILFSKNILDIFFPYGLIFN